MLKVFIFVNGIKDHWAIISCTTAQTSGASHGLIKDTMVTCGSYIWISCSRCVSSVATSASVSSETQLHLLS